MKSVIISLFVILGTIIAVTPASAQKNASSTGKIDTVKFEVAGVCKMCKERIENAALIKGVKFVEWSKETQKLTAIFKNNKVSEEEIHQAVAEHGHDTPKVKATDKNYKALPACCAYRDGVKVH